jgi:hypothetical protein
MRTALAAFLVLSLPSPAPCAELRLPDLPSFSSALQKAGLKTERIRVSLDIRSVFDGDRYDIRDSFARIDMDVSRESGGKGYRFSGTVEDRYLTGRVEQSADGSWEIWGSGLNMDMRKRGTADYEVSGFVDEEGGSRHIDVTLRQRGRPGEFSIWDSGVSIDVSKFASTTSLSGDIDPQRFGKKSLALTSVFIAVLEAELDKPQP